MNRTENPSLRRERLRKKRLNQAQRRTRSFLLTFATSDELERFRSLGENAGYGALNPYVVQLLHYATSGSLYPPDYVEGLRKEVEKLRSWLDQAREENTELRRDLKALQVQKDTLVVLANDVPEARETVARFLAQANQGAGA